VWSRDLRSGYWWVTALCVVAGTMQVEEVPPDWPPRRR
jgi:hypothetical protein